MELHTLLFFRARQRKEGGNGDGDGKEKGTIADARVVGVRANGVVVFVPRFGIEGPALFCGSSSSESENESSSSSSKEWTLSADGCGATDPVSGRSVRVFDVVTVRISVRGGGGESGSKNPNGTSSSSSSGGGGRERLVLELVDRSLLAAEDVATA